jgi:hypothetical protein
MSVEIILHPKRGSKKALKELLESLGYKPCGHLWKWGRGSLNFHWFESDQCKSYDGVEATIFKPQNSDDNNLGPCEWALHTRTRVAASPDDKEHQNQTIREARRRFGGNFYNDWYGRNRYISVRTDGRDAISRAIFLTYERVTAKLGLVRVVLPEGQKLKGRTPSSKYAKQIVDFLGEIDPVRVLYNALVPFLVASLENFFSECFKIMLRYDEKARAKLQQQNRKVEITDLIAVKNGEKTLEDIIAGWYSFQNIDSIHKAFSDWFSIDFWKVIRTEATIGDKAIRIEEQFNNLIEFRHGIVHRFDIDHGLDKAQIIGFFETTGAIIDTFVDFIEKSRGFAVKDRYDKEEDGGEID